MNIWILNQYARPRSGSGITAHAVLSHYLEAAGHEVTLFPGSISQAHVQAAVEVPPGMPYVDRFDEGVRLRYVPTPAFRRTAGRFLNMVSYASRVQRCVGDLARPDVIMGTCVHPLAVEAAGRLAERLEVPMVYEIRDIWPQSLVEMGALPRWHPVCWYFRRLESRAFRRAAGVVSVLPGIAAYASRFGVPAEKVCYVPNGVDPTLWPAASAEPETPPFVLTYFGVLGSANDLGTIIAAAAALHASPEGRAIRLRIIGDGPQRPALVRRIAQLGLANVELLPSMPKSELVSWARQSHAFILALPAMPLHELYGVSLNKLWDYLMASRPVVAAMKSLNNPLSDAAAGITVPPKAAEELARAAIQLSRLSRSSREEMGRRGRAYVLEHHDLSKLARRLACFLETVAGIPGPAQLRRAA